MDEQQLQNFAEQLGADPDAVMDRWQGRPDYVMEDLFRIDDQDSGEIRDLELFDVQRKLIHAYFYSDAGTINAYKGRRIGYSFAVVASLLLEGMFYKNSFYPLVSRSWSQAKNRIEDIERLIKRAKVDIPTKKLNSDYIELWNGTSFMAYSADADTSRGDDSARAVLLDEMAFIENQKETMRAFDAFLALGENRKMVEVSTPNTKNDLFMQEHRRGSPDGTGGVVSIKQPTFLNAEDIDVNQPLTEQKVVPARPEINVDRLEGNRMADPEGFGQEYLCRPVVDEYRFFSEDSVVRSMEASEEVDYRSGLGVSNGAELRVIGVDIGISHDDTVMQIFDHIDDSRYHRFQEVIDNDVLAESGYQNPDRGNASQVCTRIAQVYRQTNADLVVLDRTGPGETFDRELTSKIGRDCVGFNFSDKTSVEEMMGDFNNALRNDRVTLLRSDRLKDELTSIIKEKKEDWSTPKFSGKDNSQTGKDDSAMAAALAAFPPKFNVTPGRKADQKSRPSPSTPRTDQSENDTTVEARQSADNKSSTKFGGGSVSRKTLGYNSSNSYRSRHSRR